MGLKSRLFRGDKKLETAAVSDAGHITHGASGPHVDKIQKALIVLDNAHISNDELQREFYGDSTAKAVLAYKQKRSIINRAYQTTADNIVGKMTMARLDDEMVKWEGEPHPRLQIRPVSYSRRRPARPPHLAALLQQSRRVELNFALPAGALPPLALHINPQDVLILDRNSDGTFEVDGGAGGEIKVFDPDKVLIRPVDPTFIGPVQFGRSFVVGFDTEFFTVRSGMNLGEAQLDVTTPQGDLATLIVVVTKRSPSPTPFHPRLPPHNHQPCGKWASIQANPDTSDELVKAACMGCSQPKCVIDTAKGFRFGKAPLGLEHLEWYLTKNGAEKNEDLNILRWLNQDAHIRARLKREIFPPGGKKQGEGHFFFNKADYDTSKTENFYLSFGSIDRVDFSVDFSDDTVRVWFQDRYEFHPVYSGLYQKFPDDVVRDDNCVHAAAVEIKSQGATDYWMKGEALVPLALITKP